MTPGVTLLWHKSKEMRQKKLAKRATYGKLVRR